MQDNKATGDKYSLKNITANLSSSKEERKLPIDSDDSVDIESILINENLFMNNNEMLDTNEDLPIRKPQSAYVIFGKMVCYKSIHS